VRKTAETFQVENPEKAVNQFRSLLGKLLKVPKSEIGTRQQMAKQRKKRKRKKAR
jgi:hypothetical protein